MTSTLEFTFDMYFVLLWSCPQTLSHRNRNNTVIVSADPRSRSFALYFILSTGIGENQKLEEKNQGHSDNNSNESFHFLSVYAFRHRSKQITGSISFNP